MLKMVLGANPLTHLASKLRSFATKPLCRQYSRPPFELRTATSLAHLWRDQGKRDEARDLLAPIYNWFTEGFDAPVLKEAKAMLEQLAA